MVGNLVAQEGQMLSIDRGNSLELSNTFNSVTFNSVFDRTSHDTPQTLVQDLSRLQSSDDKSGTKVSLSYETSMKIGIKPDQDCSFGNINVDNLET